MLPGKVRIKKQRHKGSRLSYAQITQNGCAKLRVRSPAYGK